MLGRLWAYFCKSDAAGLWCIPDPPEADPSRSNTFGLLRRRALAGGDAFETGDWSLPSNGFRRGVVGLGRGLDKSHLRSGISSDEGTHSDRG